MALPSGWGVSAEAPLERGLRQQLQPGDEDGGRKAEAQRAAQALDRL